MGGNGAVCKITTELNAALEIDVLILSFCFNIRSLLRSMTSVGWVSRAGRMLRELALFIVLGWEVLTVNWRVIVDRGRWHSANTLYH